MKRVYSHDNPFLVFNIRNILENNGVRCEIKNDIMSSAAGEAPPIEVWPEVWVIRESDYQRADQLIEEAIHGDPKATSWFCQNCSETNAPAFELCWKCGEERP
mgnify:FL=1